MKKYIAYEPSQNLYVSYFDNAWTVTSDRSLATSHKITVLQRGIAFASKLYPGKWEIHNASDAERKTVLSISSPASSSPSDIVACVPVSLEEKLRQIQAFRESFSEERYQELMTSLSSIELEICDIYHYIEFNALNAAEGFKAYKLLHEALLRRRAFKDEISLFNALYESDGKNILNGCFAVSHDRGYHPRKLPGLFS